MIELLSSIEFWFGVSLGIIFDEIGRKALRARLGLSTPTDDDESAPTESK